MSELKGGQVSCTKDESSGIATVTLMHGKKRNAISGQMIVDMVDIVEDLKTWKTGKAVIIQGEGNTFCAGGDLKSEQQLAKDPRKVRDFFKLMTHTLDNIPCLPLLTVSIVHGKAIGFGAEIVTATDFRVFTDSGEIVFSHAKVGVATVGGATNLVNVVGFQVALDILSTCRGVNLAEALEVGLVDNSIIEENRYENTVDWLKRKIEPEAQVLQTLKRNIIGARDLNRRESIVNEQDNYLPLVGGPAHIRAIEKFMNRQKR